MEPASAEVAIGGIGRPEAAIADEDKPPVDGGEFPLTQMQYFPLPSMKGRAPPEQAPPASPPPPAEEPPAKSVNVIDKRARFGAGLMMTIGSTGGSLRERSENSENSGSVDSTRYCCRVLASASGNFFRLSAIARTVTLSWFWMTLARRKVKTP